MIKLLLNIFLILLTFLACYIEDLYLVLRVPLQGEQAALTLRAHQAFDFDQGKALNDKRMAALSHYTPLFSYVPENVVASKNKMQALIERLASYQVQKRDVDDSFLGDLRRELGIEVSRETIAGLIRYKNLKKLLEGVATIQETILKGMILENSDHLKGNNGIEIQMPGSKELVKQPSKDLMTLPQARKLLNVKVKQLSWQVDKEVLEPVLQIHPIHRVIELAHLAAKAGCAYFILHAPGVVHVALFASHLGLTHVEGLHLHVVALVREVALGPLQTTVDECALS